MEWTDTKCTHFLSVLLDHFKEKDVYLCMDWGLQSLEVPIKEILRYTLFGLYGFLLKFDLPNISSVSDMH